jgi:uncharacterized membrane protein YhhN
MPTTLRGPFPAYAATAAIDTFLAGRGSSAAHRLRRLTKPALMPLLAWSFLESTPSTADPMRRSTLAAQALSGVGDVALLGKGDGPFLTGVGGFLGAHVAYVRAFAAAGRPWSDRSHLGGVRAATGLFAVAAPLMGWAAGQKSPRLRVPVIAYAGVLSSMVATSTRLEDSADPRARRTVAAGTALFLTSDSILGIREFVVRDPSPRTQALLDVAVMATYTTSQALIASGVARMVRARAQLAGTTRV